MATRIFKRRIQRSADVTQMMAPSARGAIDGLDDGVVRGWFIAGAGVDGNDFELSLDGVVCGTFSSDVARPDVLAAEGVEMSGFEINLRKALANAPDKLEAMYDGEPHLIALRCRTGRVVAQAEVRAAGLFRGFLDRVDSTGLEGWAIDEARPRRPVALSVFVDGVHFTDIKTDRLRKDLISKEIAGDAAGLTLSWPKGVLPKGAVVDVRFSDGSSLRKSPGVVRDAVPPERPATTYLDHHRNGDILPVTVVVPVFNATAAVRDCLESLARHLPAWAHVLVVDDCSTASDMSALLREFEGKKGFQVARNPSNLGYTRTVNRAITLVSGRDVVLLNSDTVVTDRWLDSLRYCAYARPRVATVTALSDNAGAFSAPEFAAANDCPPHLDRDRFAAVVRHAGLGRVIEVPTGNGFCMYIRSRAIAEIGLFDEVKFPRGYGEENDYCMRALRLGWLNLVSDKAYVFHKRSQSFQGEKVELMRAGAERLKVDYPEYSMLVRRFRDGEFCRIRHLVRAAIERNDPEAHLPRLMYVISTQTGGTPQTNMDLMREMRGRYKCYLLRSDSSKVSLWRLDGDELVHVESHELAARINPISHRSDEYDRLALELMYRHDIRLVHVRHIGWHGLGLAEVAKLVGVPVVYSLHDFYSLCPSLNLLDQDLKYCGGSCTEGAGTCQIALWPAESFPGLKHGFVNRWRQMFDEFIGNCDQLVTTAPSVVRTFARVFPQHAGRVKVIPHGRELGEFSITRRLPSPSSKVRVLVPGNISLSKGAALLKEMVELDVNGRFEFHFMGARWSGLENVGVNHGLYDRNDFSAKVAQIAPHLGVVLSLCPETYCHTLTEMWAAGIPVLGLDLGAVGDRISASGAGWLMPPESSARAILDALEAAVSDPHDYHARVDAVQKWQVGEGVCNDNASMAVRYRAIYASLLHGVSDVSRVGVLLKGQKFHPAMAHARVLGPLAYLGPEVDCREVSVGWCLAGGCEQLDVLLVQRDAVPESLVEPLLEALSRSSIPFVYEIDEPLWTAAQGREARHGQAIRRLVEAALVVTTPTEAMAAELRAIGAREVVVVPHAPNRQWWLSPLDGELLSQLPEKQGRKRILVLGTAAHPLDDEIISPALVSLMSKRDDIEVVQMGGGPLVPGAIDLHVPASARSYPDFAVWFRTIASTCDLALAPLAAHVHAVRDDLESIDCGFVRLPTLCSDVEPYRTGRGDSSYPPLVSNESEQWESAIAKLLDDDDHRRDMSELAWSRSLERLAAAEEAAAWSLVIGEVGAVGRSIRPALMGAGAHAADVNSAQTESVG